MADAGDLKSLDLTVVPVRVRVGLLDLDRRRHARSPRGLLSGPSWGPWVERGTFGPEEFLFNRIGQGTCASWTSSMLPFVRVPLRSTSGKILGTAIDAGDIPLDLEIRGSVVLELKTPDTLRSTGRTTRLFCAIHANDMKRAVATKYHDEPPHESSADRQRHDDPKRYSSRLRSLGEDKLLRDCQGHTRMVAKNEHWPPPCCNPIGSDVHRVRRVAQLIEQLVLGRVNEHFGDVIDQRKTKLQNLTSR